MKRDRCESPYCKELSTYCLRPGPICHYFCANHFEVYRKLPVQGYDWEADNEFRKLVGIKEE